MAKKAGELEEAAVQLLTALLAAIPQQYYECPNGADPINAAWNRALRAAKTAAVELEGLGNLLRARAGITEPGPVARFFTDDPPQAEPRAVSTSGGAGDISTGAGC